MYSLGAGEFAQAGFLDGAINDRRGGTPGGGATELAQARSEPHRRAFKPARARAFSAGGALGERFGVDAEVAGRSEREGGAPEAVAGGFIRCLGEPAGEGGKIGGAVGATGATVVDLGDRSEQRRDGRASAGAKEFGLGRGFAGNKPAAETGPGLLPALRCHLERIGCGIEDIREIAAGGGSEGEIDAAGFEEEQGLGDAAGGGDEFADEFLQVIDELFLVGKEGIDADAVEFERALEAAHEGLGAGGELLETGDKGRQNLMELGVVGRAVGEAWEQGVEEFADVLEGGGLEFAGAVKVFGEDGEGLLGGFTGGAQLIKTATLIKFLNGGGVRVVGGIVEIAPDAQLLKGGGDAFGVDGADWKFRI